MKLLSQEGLVYWDKFNFWTFRKSSNFNLDKNGYSSNKFFLRSEKNYKLMKLDISLFNQNKLNKIVKKFQPEFLINLAADSHVDRSIETPLKIANQNISLTIKLLISSLRYQKYKKTNLFI